MEEISCVESVEGIESWRELREQAPAQAAEIIAGISDFENMDPVTQCAILEAQADKLILDDRRNKYLAREIMRNVEMIRLQNEYDNGMRALTA